MTIIRVVSRKAGGQRESTLCEVMNGVGAASCREIDVVNANTVISFSLRDFFLVFDTQGRGGLTDVTNVMGVSGRFGGLRKPRGFFFSPWSKATRNSVQNILGTDDGQDLTVESSISGII